MAIIIHFIKIKGILLVCLFLVFFNGSQAANFVSTSNGNWDIGSTWGNPGNNVEGSGYPGTLDNATVSNGTTVSIRNSATVNDLVVASGGVLAHSNNKTLTVIGNYTINGTHTGFTGTRVTLSGLNKIMSGIGTISLTGGIYVSTDRSIAASANLTIACDLNLMTVVTVTNNGSVTIIYPAVITSALVGPTWVNAANSTLSPGGSTNVLLNITLIASATGNTVNYYQETSQNIKIPSGNTYYNLHMTGVGTKSLIGNIIAEGNIYIDGATLNTSSYSMTVKGNWENAGTLSGTGSVIFTGTNNQTITNVTGETFYNMTLNKSGGTLLLEDDVAVSNTLTMTAGLLDANTHTLTLGTSTSVVGSLSYSNGLVFNGKFRRWINATGTTYLFPLGVAYGFYTPLKILFNNLTVSGSVEAEFIPFGTTNNGLPIVDGDTTVYNTYGTGYYTVSSLNGLTTSNFNLQAAGLPTFTLKNSTRILTRPSSSSNWVASGAHQAADLSNGYARRTGLSSLPADFVLADAINCSPPVTSSVTGDVNVCINSTEIYSVTNTPGNAYTWFITGGTQTSGGNSNSISVEWKGTSGEGLIVVAETNSCGTGLPVLVPVIISPASPTFTAGKEYAPENTSVGNEETYTVAALAGYTYSWSISGGTIVSGSSTNSVSVRWGAAGDGSITATITNGCGASSLTLPVNIYVVINSIRSGSWNSASTWDCNCIPSSYNSVRVKNPHTVTFPNSDLTITNLISDVGGIFNNTTNKTLTVTGDVLINGEYKGTNELILDGTGSIDGIGLISTSGSLTMSGGSKSILSTAVLERTNGIISIQSGLNVTNNGIVTVTGNIVGANATSYWINEENSILYAGGTLMSTGTLVADAFNNTVEYTSAASQTIFLTDYYDLFSSGTGARVLPSGTIAISGAFHPGTNSFTITGNTLNFNGAAQEIPAFTYNHLIVSNGDEKIATGAIITNGNLTIDAATTLNLDGNSLSVKGNFTNDGFFVHNGGNATFNGTLAQSLNGETTFNSVTLSNSAGLTLHNSINVDNALTISSGALSFGSSAIDVYVIGNVSGAGSIAMTGSGLAHTLTLEGSTNTIGSFTTTSGSNSLVTYAASGNQTMMSGTYQHLTAAGSGTKTATGTSSVEGNLTINSGVSLNDGGYTITVKKNISNSGTHLGTGKILLSGGSASHTISGGTFTNMELSDANGASSGSATTIKGVLTLTTGTYASAGYLSIDLNTGAIAGTGSGQISGNLQAYKSPATYDWHYIASPLNGATVADISDDVSITNTLYYYDESIVNTDKMVGWTTISSTATSLQRMKGYALFFYSPASIDITGTYTHTVAPSNSTLTHNISSVEASDGWNLMGNPYPSPLDWDAASGWTKTNIDGAIYYWDPVNARYASYVTGSGTNGGTRYIPSMQGFFLKVSSPGGTGTLGMNNNVRVTSTNPSLWRTAAAGNSLKLTASSGSYKDETVLRLRDDASVVFDAQVDAYKMLNSGNSPSLYSVLDNTHFSINSLPDSAKDMTIPLKLEAAFTGVYTLQAEEEGSFGPEFSIVLEDHLLGISQDLKSNPSYSFSIEKGDTSTRFYLNFRKTEVTAMNEKAISKVGVWSFDNQINVNFVNPDSDQAELSVFGMSGNEALHVSNIPTNGKYVIQLPEGTAPGVYMVKVLMHGMVYSGKISYIK